MVDTAARVPEETLAHAARAHDHSAAVHPHAAVAAEPTATRVFASDDPPALLGSGGGAQSAKPEVPEALPLLVGGEETANAKAAGLFTEPDFDAKAANEEGSVERVEVLSPTQVVEGS